MDGLDAVHVRDRGKLGQTDAVILDLAYREDRILVTANIADFRKLASRRELHAGIVLMEDGSLDRKEQLKVMRLAVRRIKREIAAGRDLVNRVLFVAVSGAMRFEETPIRR